MIIGKIGNKTIKSNEISTKSFIPFLENDFVKLSIMVTLAGYMEKDTIAINGNIPYDTKKMESFLSYILNDKRSSPKKFNLNINFLNGFMADKYKSATKDNNYNCIVSLSGGLDSAAGLMFALDKGYRVMPVWIGFGQKNEEEELKIVKKISSALGLKLLIVEINLNKYINQGWNRWKMGIIPARNLLFASIAAVLASNSVNNEIKIFICAHKEEITPINTDKSKRFYKTCTDIFSKITSKKIITTTPFLNITKPEIIAFWLKNWNDKYHLKPQNTTSCYYGNNCGECKACINRMIASICAGLPLEKYAKNPFSDKEGLLTDGYISRFSKLEEDRKLDILYSMQTQIKILPKNLKDFFDLNYKIYKNLINKRIAKIRSIKTF